MEPLALGYSGRVLRGARCGALGDHEAFGREEVGVDQTREEQAVEQRELERGDARIVLVEIKWRHAKRDVRREQFGRGSGIRFDRLRQALFEAGGRAESIGQVRMRPGDQVREQSFTGGDGCCRMLGAGRHVVDFACLLEVGFETTGGQQIVLKGGGVFTDVVPQPR